MFTLDSLTVFTTIGVTQTSTRLTPPATNTSRASTTPASSSSQPPSATPTNPPPDTPSLDTKAKIGIAVGVPLGFALIGSLVFIIVHDRRRLHVLEAHIQTLIEGGLAGKPTVIGEAHEMPHESGKPHEMPQSIGGLYEMPPY
ncbi:MAG: hypothetical protein M1839_002454 [Geoglossum umbratile]|nr:MAG: hypothetical protein M1839_002454 [Geoglossum umbratile]